MSARPKLTPLVVNAETIANGGHRLFLAAQGRKYLDDNDMLDNAKKLLNAIDELPPDDAVRLSDVTASLSAFVATQPIKKQLFLTDMMSTMQPPITYVPKATYAQKQLFANRLDQVLEPILRQIAAQRAALAAATGVPAVPEESNDDSYDELPPADAAAAADNGVVISIGDDNDNDDNSSVVPVMVQPAMTPSTLSQPSIYANPMQFLAQQQEQEDEDEKNEQKYGQAAVARPQPATPTPSVNRLEQLASALQSVADSSIGRSVTATGTALRDRAAAAVSTWLVADTDLTVMALMALTIR